jgi:2-hydroxymuconate-semialdehyde hydrolase
MHQRGFVGSSEATPETSAVSDAISLLDELEVESVHVVGHSGGAVLALQLATAARQRVRTLVLVDPAPLPELAGVDTMARAERALAAMGAGLESDGVSAALRAFSSVVFGEDWRGFFDAVPGGYEQAVADLNRFQSGSAAPPPERSQLSRIDQPTLVLWGEESWLAEYATTLSSAMPNAERGVIADTDHALITQRPNTVGAAIAEFIARHP